MLGAPLSPIPVPGERGGPARDAFLAVDECDGMRRSRRELLLNQREMGAGEDDRVHLGPAPPGVQRLEDAATGAWVDGLSAQLCLGELDQLRRAVAHHDAV